MAVAVWHQVPGCAQRLADTQLVPLSSHLTLMLILPLSSPTDFSTRMFSSLRSLCTMSAKRGRADHWHGFDDRDATATVTEIPAVIQAPTNGGSS